MTHEPEHFDAGRDGGAGCRRDRRTRRERGRRITDSQQGRRNGDVRAGGGRNPDFIFPIVDGAHYSVANIEQFQRLMWRPLYLYGKAGKPVLNQPASLAQAPVYTKGNTRVTITLKPYKWSDGNPVTARDFTFLLNLLKANKKNWAAYLPGDIPDNVKRVIVSSPAPFTLVLDRATRRSGSWATSSRS